MTLKQFLQKKPQLAEQVLLKVENMVQKLVEKGMSRHSIVQAIIADYVQSQTDLEKIKWLAESMKEKLPSLLASKQGLLVACSLFNVLDAKDRKTIVKSIQEPLKEMIVNKVASLFIVHILNNLDDTVISKKKILHDVLLTVDDNVNDRCFQAIFLGISTPKSKRYFTAEDIEAFEAWQDHSTSKKDPEVRRLELLQIFVKPMEMFYEERMQFYLQDIAKNPLLSRTLAARIEVGGVAESDAMDELFRQIQKRQTVGDQLLIVAAHPAVQFALKDLVRLEQELAKKDPKQYESMAFCQKLSDCLLKHFDECLKTRACWLMVQLLEDSNTKDLLADLRQDKHMKAVKAAIHAQKKSGKVDPGLAMLQSVLTGKSDKKSK